MNMTLHFGKLHRTLAWSPKTHCFYKFLFVISAEFIIRFFCTWDCGREMVFFLSDDFRNLAYGKKSQLFELRQIDFFFDGSR